MLLRWRIFKFCRTSPGVEIKNWNILLSDMSKANRSGIVSSMIFTTHIRTAGTLRGTKISSAFRPNEKQRGDGHGLIMIDTKVIQLH